MQARSLPAATGLDWIRRGTQLFRQQPFAFMTLVLAFFFACLLLLALPSLIGLAVALVLMPGLTMGFMFAARDAQAQQLILPTRLVAAFRSGSTTAQRMLGLGAFYAAAMGLVQLIIAGLDNGELAQAMSDGSLLKEDVELPARLQVTMLSAVALQVVVTAVFWFAPALVTWHALAPAKAIFFSAVAVWRNKGAFFSFTVLMTLFTLLIQAGLALIMGILGFPATLQVFIVMPTMVAIISVFYCAAYLSYEDILAEPQAVRVDTTA